MVKKLLPVQQTQVRSPGLEDPQVSKIPWRREGTLALVCLPGKSRGQRRLVGCSPWGLKESDRKAC